MNFQIYIALGEGGGGVAENSGGWVSLGYTVTSRDRVGPVAKNSREIFGLYNNCNITFLTLTTFILNFR